MSNKRIHARMVLCLLLMAGLFGGCAKNPVTGKRQLSLFSEAQEIEIGKQSHPEILRQFGKLQDENLQSYVNQLGQDLARGSHRPDLPWTFTVVDSDVINAFALPGGYIYVTRQILATMNNEAELAGVLGHEIGHVTARHGVAQASKAQLAGLALGVGSVFSPTFRQYGQLAQIGTSLLFLKYGRDAERQSDDLGVQYMYALDYDPRKISEFFNVFQNLRDQSGQQIPNLLASHPAPPDRIRATAERARQIMETDPKESLKVRRGSYLSKLDGLVYGADPRQGFAEKGTFYHPELRFKIQYPEAWRVQNTNSAVVFAEPNGSAGVQLTLVPSDEAGSPEDYANKVAQQQQVELIRGQQRNINGIPAYLGPYRLQNPQSGQVLNALAAFIQHRNLLYQLVAMAPPEAYRNYSGQLEQIVTSFDHLRDRKILNVQADTLSLYTVRSGGTLRDIHRRVANPRISLDQLADINRIDPTVRLSAGTVVKTVKAGRGSR